MTLDPTADISQLIQLVVAPGLLLAGIGYCNAIASGRNCKP